jgi:hypothetical protein
MHKIEINKHIPQERWGEFFEMFSHGNKGRLVEMEALDQIKGVAELIRSAPLSSIDFQPADEGDSVVIHTRENGSTSVHSVEAPEAVWTGQDENGVVMAMDITDKKGNHTILKIAEIS